MPHYMLYRTRGSLRFGIRKAIRPDIKFTQGLIVRDLETIEKTLHFKSS